jgi:hypothetical protein
MRRYNTSMDFGHPKTNYLRCPACERTGLKVILKGVWDGKTAEGEPTLRLVPICPLPSMPGQIRLLWAAYRLFHHEHDDRGRVEASHLCEGL